MLGGVRRVSESYQKGVVAGENEGLVADNW